MAKAADVWDQVGDWVNAAGVARKVIPARQFIPADEVQHELEAALVERDMYQERYPGAYLKLDRAETMKQSIRMLNEQGIKADVEIEVQLELVDDDGEPDQTAECQLDEIRTARQPLGINGVRGGLGFYGRIREGDEDALRRRFGME